MKKLLALAVLFAACGAALAQSAGVMLYGPFSVTLPSPETFAHSASFSVAPSAVGPYVMRVELSAPNSLTALSASLNGAQVFTLADFAGGATRVDKPVNVLPSNTIAAQVAGAPGTRITLSVFTLVMPKPVSLLPSPLELTAGRAAGTLTATLSPTPTAAGTLSLTSANPALASAPATVAFAAGQSAVPVPVSGIASGSTTITAAANGGQATASVNVNAPPSVSLTAPASNAIFTAPADITVTAQVSDADGTIAKVEYFQSSTLITTQTAPPYSFVWSAVPQGTYSLTAAATDDRGASTTSAAVTVTVNSAVAQLYYIHADHLNQPRLITNAAGQAVWRLDHGEPFGDVPPDENPSGLGAFKFPLRGGGWQYADDESGEFWNWARTYSKITGRFDQFDPTGLQHGINGFVYANLDPLRYIDRDGRAASGPNQDPAAACKYYDQVCSRTSGKCFYYCYTAPNICRYPYASPFLWGVPSEKVNCIRTCLIREDQAAWGNPQNLTKSCPACVKDSVIDDYHNKCYTSCGVSPSRYPGVRPGGIPLGNE